MESRKKKNNKKNTRNPTVHANIDHPTNYLSFPRVRPRGHVTALTGGEGRRTQFDTSSISVLSFSLLTFLLLRLLSFSLLFLTSGSISATPLSCHWPSRHAMPCHASCHSQSTSPMPRDPRHSARWISGSDPGVHTTSEPLPDDLTHTEHLPNTYS
ncbi:hypothetical protein LY78DRAFT_302171 [Colletotrichum sublineola]|nr:hypothetical protein LY78DRAFT_302171 [Colletotrichum sublineola]